MKDNEEGTDRVQIENGGFMDIRMIRNTIENASLYTQMGRIDKIVGMTIEATGPVCNIGDVCEIEAPKSEERFYAEVVGFRENKVLLMPYDEMEGIGYGSAVKNTGDKLRIPVTNALVGRTVDALGLSLIHISEPTRH